MSETEGTGREARVVDDRFTGQMPSQMFMDGGYGTGRDVAIYMGVSEPSVWRFCRRGQLKGYRVAGLRLVRFKRADCDEFMATRPAFTNRKPMGVRHGR